VPATKSVCIPRIKVACPGCRKSYRVSVSKRGRVLQCKRCMGGVPIPKDDTRAQVLAELGIDPAAARRAYERERNRCDGCGQVAADEELDFDIAGDRKCRACQGGSVRLRRSDETLAGTGDTAAEPKGPTSLATSLGLTTLIVVGIAGLVHTCFDPAAWISLVSAAPFGLLGLHQLRRG
jgi:hypothetical protein